jgi:3-hydroxyacyl-[acyl-carrier-protein] dehydratase
VRGRLTVRSDLPGLQGHFPGHPILPGVYLVEAAEQLMALADPSRTLRTVDRLRLVRAVRPGEEIALSVVPGRDPDSLQIDVRASAGEPVGSLTVGVAPPPAPTAQRPPNCWNNPSELDIVAMLPQRWPLLLIDRVCGHRPAAAPQAAALCARKAVTLSDPAYGSARPGWDTGQLDYPSSLLLESLGQAAALLALAASGPIAREDVLMFAAARGFRRFARVGPGAVLHHVVNLERADERTMVARAETWACDMLVGTVDQLIAVRRPAR